MDIWLVVLIVIAAVLVIVAFGSPQVRHRRDADDLEARTHYDMDRQFKRPPNEGDLL
jgi:hypothetical protein